MSINFAYSLIAQLRFEKLYQNFWEIDLVKMYIFSKDIDKYHNKDLHLQIYLYSNSNDFQRAISTNRKSVIFISFSKEPGMKGPKKQNILNTQCNFFRNIYPRFNKKNYDSF